VDGTEKKIPVFAVDNGLVPATLDDVAGQTVVCRRKLCAHLPLTGVDHVTQYLRVACGFRIAVLCQRTSCEQTGQGREYGQKEPSAGTVAQVRSGCARWVVVD